MASFAVEDFGINRFLKNLKTSGTLDRFEDSLNYFRKTYAQTTNMK